MMHSSAGSDHPDLESREGPWFESIPILGTGNASTKKTPTRRCFLHLRVTRKLPPTIRHSFSHSFSFQIL